MNDNVRDNPLWAVFLEATNGAKRVQWMLFPPALAEHGADRAYVGRQRFIKRRMDYAGHRAKWNTTEKQELALRLKLGQELDQYESTGWSLKAPILIVLEHDDYLKAWEGGGGKTPYKALRHVEKVAMKRGYRLTS